MAHNDPGYRQKSDSIDAFKRVRAHSFRTEDPQGVCVGWKSLDNLQNIKFNPQSTNVFPHRRKNLDEFLWLEVKVKDVEENITDGADQDQYPEEDQDSDIAIVPSL